MKPLLPGLHHADDDVEVTTFGRSLTKTTLTAKWWMRPICWILRKPTTRTVYR